MATEDELTVPNGVAAPLDLSAGLGADPLLVPGDSGRTSIKVDGQRWINASGTRLADARLHDVLLPRDLGAMPAPHADWQNRDVQKHRLALDAAR